MEKIVASSKTLIYRPSEFWNSITLIITKVIQFQNLEDR